MMIKKIYMSVLVGLSVVLIPPVAVSAGEQGNSSAVALTSDNYPIKHDLDAWKLLKDHKSMVNAVQISKSSLNKMSTERLIDVCLDYPLFNDMLAYNTLQDGFNKVTDQFDGLKDLLERNDASIKLLEKYENLDVKVSEKGLDVTQRGKIGEKIRYIEVLLAQDKIINKLSKKDRKRLIISSLNKLDEKKKDADTYGALGIESSALVFGRVTKKNNVELFARDYNSEKLNKFLITGSFAEDVVINEAIIQAQAQL